MTDADLNEIAARASGDRDTLTMVEELRRVRAQISFIIDSMESRNLSRPAAARFLRAIVNDENWDAKEAGQ